jgi:hypothetical protein
MSNSKTPAPTDDKAQAAERPARVTKATTSGCPDNYTLTLTQSAGDGTNKPVTISIEVVNDSIHQLTAKNSRGVTYDVKFYLRKHKPAQPSAQSNTAAGGPSGSGGNGGEDDDDDDDDGGECKFCTTVNGVTTCEDVPCSGDNG